MTTRWQDIVSLVIAVAIPLAVGAVGGIATSSSVSTWFPTLAKPPWNPPNWLFGPVWTLLYILMGVALWLVWRKGLDAAGVRGALILFGVQLLFNLGWSVIFFGLRRTGWALVEIVTTWVLILATLIAFYRLRPAAGWLLAPYQLWVTFATALNASIWWLNR
jgi:tryptophan-rich sensory protein